MLTASELKPFLLHEDRFVRQEVVKYFSDSWSQDPDVLPMCLEACARYGDAANPCYLYDHFAVTDVSLELLLGRLAQATEENVVHHFNAVLLHTPVSVWQARESAIRAAPRVLPETLERLERRRQLAERPGEALWQELQDYSEKSKDKRHVGDIDHAYADDLIEALAVHPVPDPDTLGRLLRSTEIEDQWLEVFVVDLAGQRRLPEAVPVLVDKLLIDTDYLLEQAVVALSKIGDPEAVRRIRAHWGSAPWHFQLYAAGVLGHVKHPESEDTVLALLEHEEDSSIRAWLSVALTDSFSARGVEVLQREVEHGYDRSITNLEENLVVLADVLGLSFPEVPRWRAARAKRAEAQAKRLAKFAEWAEQLQRSEEQRPVSPKTAAAPHQEDEFYPAPKQVPFQRTQARVGRNDPCPCGSGKKFKKCCGGR
jgi:hypothetical protein